MTPTWAPANGARGFLAPEWLGRASQPPGGTRGSKGFRCIAMAGATRGTLVPFRVKGLTALTKPLTEVPDRVLPPGPDPTLAGPGQAA